MVILQRIWCLYAIFITSIHALALRKPVMRSPSRNSVKTDNLVLCQDVQPHEALEYLQNGHIKMPRSLDASLVCGDIRSELLRLYEEKQLSAMQHLVQVVYHDVDLRPATIEECQALLDKSSEPQDRPFLQLFHLWRESSLMKQVACSAQLARLAAQLMGVPNVRLYQDSLFVKRPGDGPTEWHSDLNMVPLDTNDFITCWIPLQPVPETKEGGTGLVYATKSHRDFSLLYCKGTSSMCLMAVLISFIIKGYGTEELDLTGRYAPADHGSYAVGDCSFHHGWCLHA